MPSSLGLFRCSDCGEAATIYYDPHGCVPCCARCLQKLYPAWEYREKMERGEFDRDHVLTQARIGTGA